MAKKYITDFIEVDKLIVDGIHIDPRKITTVHSWGDHRNAGYTTSASTQLTDAQIAAMGYIKTYTDTNTQLSDAQVGAMGYIKTYTDTNTQLTDAQIAAMGYATTGYVSTAISNLVASSPATLDTLNELAAALGDDPNFATTVTNSIATKLPLTGGTITTNALTVNSQFIFNSSLGSNYREGVRFNNSTTGWGGAVFGGVRNSINGISEAWWVARNPSKDFVIAYGTSSDSGGLHLPHNSSALEYKGSRIWNASDFTNNSANWNTAYTHSQAAHAPSNANYYVRPSSSTTFNVTPGNDYGIGFWADQTNYTIKMGNNQANHGTVTDYSMHHNMGTTAGRGFTFGHSRTAVTASINALTGAAKFNGTLTASGYNDGNWNTAYSHSQAAHAPSNANYITNNNQLTNGAGYLVASGTIDTAHSLYISDTRGAVRAPNYYPRNRVSWDFQNSADTLASGDSWHGLMTVSKWSSWDASHTQNQLVFTGPEMKFREASSDTAWGAWRTLYHSSNLSLATLGYTGATNANYITNNNQLTNGAGYTTYTANQALNTNSGPTFQNVYVNDWFRNNASGEGMYNQATGNHWYSDGAYWNVGYSGTTGIKLRNGHNGTVLGTLYAETNGTFGLLDNNNHWAVRVNTGTSPLELRCDNNVEFEVYNSYTNSPGSSRAPIFYDSNNTGYYLDPASTSNVNAHKAYSYQGNGNVGGTGSASWHPSGMYSGSTQWLYGNMYRGNAGTYDGGLAQYSIVYDTNNTGYYVDPASTSTVNKVNYINNSIPIVVKVNYLHKSWAHHVSSSDDYVLVPSGTDGGEDWAWSSGFNFNSTGNITANNFLLRSDERLKTKITDLSCDNIDVAWKSFELKSDEGNYRTGVIAQELEIKHPEFVNTDNEGFKSVKYIDLLIAKIAELEARLEKAGL